RQPSRAFALSRSHRNKTPAVLTLYQELAQSRVVNGAACGGVFVVRKAGEEYYPRVRTLERKLRLLPRPCGSTVVVRCSIAVCSPWTYQVSMKRNGSALDRSKWR